MNLKLQWKNLNSVDVTTEIYRGTAPLDRANLGTPIVTLTNQETSYIDPNAVRGTLYYYVFVTLTANDRNVSQNVAIRAESRRGPGPNALQTGDYAIGYFGTVPSAEFINTADLMKAVNLTGVTPFTYAPIWLKYVRNNKICFVPNQGLVATNVSYKMLYDLGLVFGTDDAGYFKPSGSADVNQRKVISIGADQYIVRLMKGFGEDPTVLVDGGIDALYEGVCEWTDFISPMYKPTGATQRLINCYPDNGVGMGSTTTGGFWTQECVTAGSGYIARSSTYLATNKQHFLYKGSAAPSVARGWYPVLELVEA